MSRAFNFKMLVTTTMLRVVHTSFSFVHFIIIHISYLFTKHRNSFSRRQRKVCDLVIGFVAFIPSLSLHIITFYFLFLSETRRYPFLHSF